jgi:hypothetical protein
MGFPALHKKEMQTPEEINDEIREQVNREFPKPPNGFETELDEMEWKERAENRFMELVSGWNNL